MLVFRPQCKFAQSLQQTRKNSSPNERRLDKAGAGGGAEAVADGRDNREMQMLGYGGLQGGERQGQESARVEDSGGIQEIRKKQAGK